MLKTKVVLAVCFFLISANVFAEMQRGISGHAQGDVIAVQKDEEIASWCDFTKQIVVTATNVLCVYRNNRPSQ